MFLHCSRACIVSSHQHDVMRPRHCTQRYPMKIWHRIPNLRPRESPRTNFQCCPRGFEISSGNYSAPFGRIQILTPESESVTPRKLPYKFSILLRWVEISSANYSAPWGASKIWDRIWNLHSRKCPTPNLKWLQGVLWKYGGVGCVGKTSGNCLCRQTLTGMSNKLM